MKTNNFDFFKGKRVFITGHTGFKGSWLTQILVDAGAEVSGYSNPESENRLHFDALGLESKINNYEGDIRNSDFLFQALRESNPNIVFHLAAQALVRKSYENPKETYETNVIGSLNLLNAVRNCENVGSVVYVTSDKCYENQEWVWGYKETDLLGGSDPYSSSKACAEILFSSFHRSFFLNSATTIVSARAGNVIGGGDWSADRIVPDCVRAALSDSEIILRNPASTRPWQHVLEPLSGYLQLAEASYIEPGKFQGSWNFGPASNETKTVEEIASTMLQILKGGKIVIENTDNKYHEAKLLQLNCEKAINELHWRPRWNVHETIEKTASWYKEYSNGVAALDITRRQISEYFGGGQ